jgi:hypothetical protein
MLCWGHASGTKLRPVVAATTAIVVVACLARATDAQPDGLTLRGEPIETVYSHWSGGCSVNKIAGASCAMRSEARSASGELVGFVVFGEEEQSRFLVIEAKRSITETPLFIKIDGLSIAGKPVKCRTDSDFCSVVFSVGDKLLRRLMEGLVLSADVEGGVRLHFPLQDFARARRDLL